MRFCVCEERSPFNSCTLKCLDNVLVFKTEQVFSMHILRPFSMHYGVPFAQMCEMRGLMRFSGSSLYQNGFFNQNLCRTFFESVWKTFKIYPHSMWCDMANGPIHTNEETSMERQIHVNAETLHKEHIEPAAAWYVQVFSYEFDIAFWLNRFSAILPS